jgi:hypothetical protein
MHVNANTHNNSYLQKIFAWGVLQNDTSVRNMHASITYLSKYK